jgi:hypothetical protein
MSKTSNAAKQFLFIAHPGHELCVHGWLESARPRVFVLTDGSGRLGQSRIGSTTKVLRQAGAEPGTIYGRLTDAEIYQAILDHDFELFLSIADEFAETLERDEADSVTGDAIEGFNPTHDVCRLIINAAVKLARLRYGRMIANTDFLLVGRHDTQPPKLRAQTTWLRLTEDAFRRKLESARGFPELRSEIDAALDGELQALRQHAELGAKLTLQYNAVGLEAYRVECLRPVDERRSRLEFSNELPFYERYGELRVSEGNYQSVIRYREHILPIAESLQTFVERQRPF